VLIAIFGGPGMDARGWDDFVMSALWARDWKSLKIPATSP
jgi:hypothetical protein